MLPNVASLYIQNGNGLGVAQIDLFQTLTLLK